MKDHILSLFLYDVWADELLSASTSVSILDLDAPSSFATLRKTWYHKWDAEQAWFCRLTGEQPKWPFCETLSMEWNDLVLYIQSSKREHNLWLAEQPESWFSESLTYHNLKGVPFTNPHYGILYHLINHGTFHRGQVVTQLRQLGVEKIPATDLIAYYRK